jgi:NADH-quinone oxidoreductase subunit M
MPLSILIWLPAAVGLVAALLPRSIGPRLAALGTLGALGIAIGLIADYDPSSGMQHVTDETWIADLGIHYKLGLDGLNLFLVALTTLGFAAAAVAANFRTWERSRLFYFHLLLGETAVLGAFLAQDLALFVAFFDLMLIPFYFLAGQWGDGENRVAAVTKLVVYTFVGSLLMLAAAIATGVMSASDGQEVSFALSDLRERTLGEGTQQWLFLLFAAAFLVKMPAFPLHGWMPDGYRAMPIPVLAVFSGVLSKVGAYGFMRIVLPTFPDASAHFQELMLILAVVSILYGSAMAFTTTNARLVVGYSSVAQLGFITLGIFALNDQGAQGALLQMINHGLVVIPLFLIIGVLAQRAGSEDLRDMGGIAFRAPVLATLFLIVALATLAMPGSSNFVGEFLILLGVFESKMAIAFVASIGIALAAVYGLRLFIRAMHNRVGASVESREIALRDAVVLVPLVAVILFFAVYPQLALSRGEDSVVSTIAPAVEVTR